MSPERAASPLRQALADVVTTLTQLADAETEPEPATTVELPKADVDPLIKAYKRAEKRAAGAKEALESAKEALLTQMAGADVLKVAETQQPVVEHREVHSLVLDTVRLKREQPQVAADYQKPRVQRPFKVLV